MKLTTALLSAACVLALAPAAHAERGADGQLNIFYWQAPSILNAYLSGGTKDLDAAALIIEPLASFDANGEVYARLAESVPTVENGGVSADLTTITWKIKPGILWSDGTPFTSADVVFTAAYCMDPAGGCSQLAKYQGVKTVEAIDDLTVKITFDTPKPYPYAAFVGAQSPVIQKAQFEACTGAAAPTCTAQNFAPIGTGPFMVTDFKTNDTVQLAANPNYRDPAKPAFATINLKGGGDAEAAARSVLETGEFDYAWNLQLSPEVLGGMAAAGKGEVIRGFGSLVERLEMNMTDPSPSLPEGERSTAKNPHPILSDLNVRKALSMAIDRTTLVEIGYGPAGMPTCNLVPAPAAYASDNTGCIAQDMAGAKALLDAAGWVPGADGVREKDGMRLKLVYQTSTNAVRQDFQALIKSSWNELGVEVELKNIDASVFFGGDAGSPDTFQKFYADVEMYANEFDGTDPQSYLANYTCDKAPNPENQWQGENINRFCDPAYDALVSEMSATGDPAKRSELAKKMNDMLTKDSMVIVPLAHRGRNSGKSVTLGGVVMNPWDSELSTVQDWFRVK
ncbi:MAG: peptide ABC transporter substrate-binding protein [Pseudomonadota bacterium]